MSLTPRDPETDPIETALRRLTPAPSRIDRDRLMFQAGFQSARAGAPRTWVWPSVAAALALVSLSEWVLLASRPGPARSVGLPPAAVANAEAGGSPSRPGNNPAPEAVHVLVQGPTQRTPEHENWPPAEIGSLGLRQQVLRFGLEGLPDPPSLLSQADVSAPDDAGAESPQMLRRHELDRFLNPGGPS